MLFWNLYSAVYRKLADLKPYQEHAIRIIELMSFKDEHLFLDVGCGAGLMVGNRRNVIGVDVSEPMLKMAQKRNQNTRFVQADLNHRLPFCDDAFQGALSNNVLAYLTDPEATLREVFRILKPGSRFVLATLRKRFNPAWILLDHARKESAVSLVRNFFYVILILILNIPIVLKLRTNRYHGFELQSLSELCLKCGFEVVTRALSYAEQDVLLELKKG